MGEEREKQTDIKAVRDQERHRERFCRQKSSKCCNIKALGIIHGFIGFEIFPVGFSSLFGPFLTQYIILPQSLNGNVSAMPLCFGSTQFAF